MFEPYRFDPDQVARIMRRHGCELAPDGFWSCGGKRASIRFATTTGNVRRQLIQDRLVLQARAAGIELERDNSPSEVLFGTRLPAGDFDLVMFAWLQDGDPLGLGGLYGCDGAQNHMDYCSRRVTQLFEAVEVEVSRPAALAHRADAILADDAPSIPFFQHPLVLANDTTLQGLANNAGPQGLTWNVEEWRLN